MTNSDADQQAVLPLVSVAFTVWTSALLGLPEDLVDLNDRASPGGQTSGTASHQNCRLPSRVGRVWHPPASLKGCRAVGLRQADGMPHDPPASKIVGDHAELVIVWTLYGHKTHPDNPK
jgi:hypothetical protein